jgi:hypothetical protein
MIFNGPGQGDALWVRKIFFRPDWEKVIKPVVDAMLRRPEVDPKRIALIGISQGGYWVPRALAFEHRIAAGVADPGVWDVSEPWLSHLPAIVRGALDARDKDRFDQYLQMGTAANARARGTLRFRMRPFGMTSYYDAFQAVQEYRLAGVVGRIRCPMLITAPEGEQFFPGQAQKLYDGPLYARSGCGPALRSGRSRVSGFLHLQLARRNHGVIQIWGSLAGTTCMAKRNDAERLRPYSITLAAAVQGLCWLSATPR